MEESGPETARRAPGVEAFPGDVPEDAERLSRSLSLDPVVPGWHSTGLYAVAGESVIARTTEGSSEGWSLRIGAHTDSIAQHAGWMRWPSVSRRFDLTGGETRVASPFGGLIYLEPGPRARGPLRLEIAGGVQAPYFDLRSPASERDWKALRAAPAPWAEIAGELLILTVPSEAVRGLADPAPVAEFWDAVMRAHYRLAGRPLPTRPERFVADVQISVGYMHSGYPIMTGLDVTRPSAGHPLGLVLDVERLRKEGSWGHFHELGHNLQRPEWTFSGTGEVTCNLFALHAGEKLCGIDPWSNPWLESQKSLAGPYFEKGAPFEAWQGSPGLALLMYAEVQHAFGWDPFYAVLGEYETLSPEERPETDQEKRDQWMVHLSRAVQRDLGPFFERWGLPISPAARNRTSGFEEWTPP